MILTEEQEMIRATAREFAEAELTPHAPEWDRNAEFPAEAVHRMGELGFLGMLVPEAWDGSNTGHVSYALALEEIAAGDGGCSTIMSVQNSVVNVPILNSGSREQKERFLRPLASGAMRGGFALTEPQAGSDASNLRVRATLDGNRYILSGTKQFITSGETADVMLTFAVTDPDSGKKGISAFLVPTDLPGYRVARKEDKLGQRSSDTCQIVFEDMEITPDLMLGPAGGGISYCAVQPGRRAHRRSRHSPWVWLARPAKRHWLTLGSGRLSARRSSGIRPWPFGSPTWQRRSRPPGRWFCTWPNCVMPVVPA